MSSVVAVTFTVDLQNSRTAVPKGKGMTFRRIVLVVCFMFCKAYGSDYETSKVLLAMHMNSEIKQYLYK